MSPCLCKVRREAPHFRPLQVANTFLFPSRESHSPKVKGQFTTRSRAETSPPVHRRRPDGLDPVPLTRTSVAFAHILGGTLTRGYPNQKYGDQKIQWPDFHPSLPKPQAPYTDAPLGVRASPHRHPSPPLDRIPPPLARESDTARAGREATSSAC